ncbi:MAG: hypothetical protein IJH94_06005 [Clostridia bacterium]|nr:hypothetical protein [Clostridia bacterium]
MLYTEPKINISKFETVHASGTIPADATASDMGYDVSVSYEELFPGSGENVKPILGFTR